VEDFLTGLERPRTIAALDRFFQDVVLARKLMQELEDFAGKPIDYKELKTNEVLTPPKAKLFNAAR
jgi:hypothetical protein